MSQPPWVQRLKVAARRALFTGFVGWLATAAAIAGSSAQAEGSAEPALGPKRIREAVELLWRHADLDAEAWRAALRKAGYSEKEAQLLVCVVPEAFAVPVLEKLGVQVQPILGVPTRNGDQVRVNWRAWPVFMVVVEASRSKLASGPAEDHMRIAGRSGSMKVVSKALKSGVPVEKLKGSKIASVIVGPPFAEDLGELPIYEGATGK